MQSLQITSSNFLDLFAANLSELVVPIVKIIGVLFPYTPFEHVTYATIHLYKPYINYVNQIWKGCFKKNWLSMLISPKSYFNMQPE